MVLCSSTARPRSRSLTVVAMAALFLAVGCQNTTGSTSPEPSTNDPEPDNWEFPGGPSTPTPEGSPETPSPGTPSPDSPSPEPSASPEVQPTENDVDGDTIENDTDNCVDDFNPLQNDFDEDGLGNECDPDSDNDGSLDVDDCAPFNASVHPGATEIIGNLTDEDCDGVTASWVDAPIDCSTLACDSGVDALLCAMEVCYPDHLLNAFVSSPTDDNVTDAVVPLAHYGDPDNDLPAYLDSYTYLGTGRPNSTHQDELPGFNSSIDPFNSASDPIYDAVELTIRMTAPSGVGGFAIDYIFFSAEYEEWIGSEYNDKFYMVLNAPQTTNGVDKIINFTNCSSPNSYSDFVDPTLGPQCYIAINTAFSEGCFDSEITNIDGTNFECSRDGSSTGWLTTTWNIQPDEVFELTFHIHDTSDSVYDSAVLLDHFRWVGVGAKTGTE